MKKVILKRVTVADGSDVKLDYLKQMKLILVQPENSQGGTDIEQMRKVCRILDILDEVVMPELGDGVVILEDADHEYIAMRMEKAPWMSNDRELLAMIDGIKDAVAA